MKTNIVLFAILGILSSFVSHSQSAWHALPGASGGTDGEVLALYHDTTYLWIGGHFTHAGGISVQNVVRHNGNAYIPTPGLVGDCWTFMRYKNKTYAGGRFKVGTDFYGLMRFDDTAWAPLMKITDGFGSVYALAVYNGKLLVGGDFTNTNVLSLVRLAQYDGTNWTYLLRYNDIGGATLWSPIRTLFVDGNKLYIGGDFYTTNLPLTTPSSWAGYCLVWNGVSWSSLPVAAGNINGVRSIFRYQNELWASGYINGYFCCPYLPSGSLNGCNGIVKGPMSNWTHWNSVGSGLSLLVWAATTFNGLVYAGGTSGGTFYPAGTNRLWTWDGYQWIPDPAFNPQGVSWTVSVLAMAKSPDGMTLYIGGQFLVNGANNIVYAGVGSTLPVTLTSFSGLCAHGETTLSWTTSLEINNDHFDIQYAADGVNFERVGKVSGHGNATEEIDYSWTSSSNPDGYYRLEQVDYDGAKAASKIIFVSECSNPNSNFQIFPTYTHKYISISGISVSSARGEVYDMQSQKVCVLDLVTSNGTFDVSALLPGTYFLVVNDAEGNREVGRFCKF